MTPGVKRGLGILLIIGPIIGLVILLAAYAITGFVVSGISEAESNAEYVYDEQENAYVSEVVNEDGSTTRLTTSNPDVSLASTIGSLINLVLSILGVLLVIGVIIGIPLGIYFLATASDNTKTKKKKSS